jgi:hypothetical protein
MQVYARAARLTGMLHCRQSGLCFKLFQPLS